MARVSQCFLFPYVVMILQTSNPPFASLLGYNLTTHGSNKGFFQWSKYRFQSLVWGWRIIAPAVDSIIHQIFDAKYLLTPYVHNGIEGSKGNHVHDLGMGLCRIKVTLVQKSYNCLFLVTRKISVRFKGKMLATKVNLLHLALYFIYLLLKILDLDILNPLSTLACQNGGVALDVKSLLRFLQDQNFPP